MVKQRFLTHFRPWLIAVTKAGALIVAYQFFDQVRTHLQHPPLNIPDVAMAATVALFVLALFCMARAWGEWCWFRLRRLRGFSSERKLTFVNHRS